jgi:CBS domain-containing protein
MARSDRNRDKPGSFSGTDVPNTPRSEHELGRETMSQGGEKARDVMTRNPASVNRTESLERAAQLMIECDCGAVPVVDDDGRKPVGMITDRDIVVRAVAKGRNPLDLTVRDCMTNELFTVREDDSIQKVFRTMSENKVRRVPVVDENGGLVGIVAQADIAIKAEDDRKVEKTVEQISRPDADRR